MRTEAQIILEQLRKDFNISDEKIADKLGVKAITIYRWRLGKFNPSFTELKLLKRIWIGHITKKTKFALEPSPALIQDTKVKIHRAIDKQKRLS